MSGGQTFSLSEASGLLGVHRNTLAGWLKQGCPYVARADRARGVEWELSLPDIVAWREARAVQAAIGDVALLSLDEAKKRKVAAEAALAELELARQRHEVVDITAVEKVVSDEYTACRARLLAIPHKVAPLLDAVTGLAERRDLIEQSITEALRELSSGGSLGDDEAEDGAAPGAEGTPEAAAEADSQRVGGRKKAAER